MFMIKTMKWLLTPHEIEYLVVFILLVWMSLSTSP